MNGLISIKEFFLLSNLKHSKRNKATATAIYNHTCFPCRKTSVAVPPFAIDTCQNTDEILKLYPRTTKQSNNPITTGIIKM